MNKLCCLILGLSLFSTNNVSAQDSIPGKFHIHAGAEIIPGLTLGWKSKDYEILPIRYEDDEEGKSIVGAFIACGLHSDFYFDRIIVSAGALISFESLNAYVPFKHGTYVVRYPHYDLDYSGKYLDFPLCIGWVCNKNAENKKTFIKVGAIISFNYYERNKIYNSSIFYIGNSSLLADYTKYTYNKDVISRKVKYNRTCILFTLGRETPFIKNTPIYFKRALTIITAPVNIQRNTTDIFTSSRLGIELGFSYRIK